MSIVSQPFTRTLYGFAGTFQRGKAWETVKPLMDRLWGLLRTHKMANRGNNHMLYGPRGQVFVGVELEVVGDLHGLEERRVLFSKYASWKHRGEFSDIPQGYRLLQEEIMKSGLREGPATLEIYGHVRPDDTVSEMEVLIEVL